MVSEMDGNTVLKRAWRVSHELPEENRIAFFDEAQSELVVVNALGGAVWQLLDGQLTVDELCQMLSEEVQGAPEAEQVKAQVLPFLSGLLERHAVERVLG
jgi:hypothetical protein